MWHATNGRPAKLQLAKVTVFGKCRLAKRLATPCTFLKIASSKTETLFLKISPMKLSKDFWNFCLYVEVIDFEGGPR